MIDYTIRIDHYLCRFFSITRSITGEGNRETLKILQEIVPLEIKEYPSGQNVYDWVIPKEWNIKDAWIKNSKGDKIVDFQKSNLHVVSYSQPIHKHMPLAEIRDHLHYLEHLPQAIPYRTSYYEEDWGFCLSFEQYQQLIEDRGPFEVLIDSEIKNGSLSIGELRIEGKRKKEILISTYICHPSMANDNLSGVILTAFLAKELLKRNVNYSYRIVFVPETIGAIAYCANNEEAMKRIDCGFVVSCVGGPGKFGYKQSFDKNHFINKIIEQTFKESNKEYITYPFDIHGSDERQYSSPGFRINAATICKDRYYEYDYYHTSLDDLAFVSAATINDTLMLYLKTINKLDKNITYKSRYPCEAMLSRHGLYPKAGGGLLPGNPKINDLETILWLLFYSDGNADLFEISEKLNMDIGCLYSIAHKLEEKGVIARI